MKTQMNLFLVTALLLPQLSHATNSVVSDQSLGDRYESPNPATLDIFERSSRAVIKNVEYFYFTDNCGSSVPYQVEVNSNSFLYQRMVTYQVPASSDYVTQVSEKVKRGDRDSTDVYRETSGMVQHCFWDNHKVFEYVKAHVTSPWMNAKAGISLDRMTADGTGVDGRFIFQNPGFSKILASGADSYFGFMNLKLTSCLTDQGDPVISFNDDQGRSTDLLEIIKNLRRRGYRNFIKCQLLVNVKTMDTDTFTDGEVPQLAREVSNYYTLNLQTQSPDHLFLTGCSNGCGMIDQFVRAGAPRDPAKEQLALQAAQKFVSFVDNDYADFLYSLNDEKISETERNESIRAFFKNHTLDIKAWLGTIDENYANVSLMNKISMMISIQDMYRTIAKVEKSISTSSNIDLDRIVHQNN